LRAKAGPHVEVTGLVPDLCAEIARSQMYVAPLFSGSGFRNKIIEALHSGTFVIGTPMALEFLEERLRSKLLSASTADEFAGRILNFLENPRAFDQRLREAIQFLRREYPWPVRVRQLEAMFEEVKRPQESIA
jgi:glycosyltransferase involved in cell wall biosynthesis